MELGKAFRAVASDYFHEYEKSTPDQKRAGGGPLNRYNDALDRSTEHFKRALEIDPNNREALLKLVYNYCMDGRIETALKLAEPWLAKKKDDKELKAVVAELKKAKAKSARGFKPAEQIVAAISKSMPGVPVSMGFKNDSFTLQEMNVLQKVKDRQVFDQITFDEWSADLTQQNARDQIAEIGKALKEQGLDQYRIIVEGHTDNLGDLDRNQALSEDRAAGVKKYLTETLGVDPNKVDTQGFGPKRPKVDNDTPANRQINRRVEVIFSPVSN